MKLEFTLIVCILILVDVVHAQSCNTCIAGTGFCRTSTTECLGDGTDAAPESSGFCGIICATGCSSLAATSCANVDGPEAKCLGCYPVGEQERVESIQAGCNGCVGYDAYAATGDDVFQCCPDDQSCFEGVCCGTGSCGEGAGCSTANAFVCSSGLTCIGGVCTTPPVVVAGDPRITGPSGEQFDFYGQQGGTYTLLSSPRVIVNMQVDNLPVGEGPAARYMDKLGVNIGSQSIIFDTTNHDDAYMNKINKQLYFVNASAAFGNNGKNVYTIIVDICDGQRIVISQMMTKPEWEPASFGLKHEQYYLDVEFDIAGCHDEFAGVLGQLYQCKFATQKNKFEWNADTEESFRVPTLMSTSSSKSFVTDDGDSINACPAKHQYGALLANGKSKSSSKRAAPKAVLGAK